MIIIDDPLIKEFLQNRNIKPKTQRNYIYHLSDYCKATNKNPSELIEEAEVEEDKKIRLRLRKIKKHLKTFDDYLDAQNYSKKHKQIARAIVRSFYEEYEIQLPKTRSKQSKTEYNETINDIPTKDDIKKAVKHSNLKYQAIILLMSSSGMGSSEIRNLTYHDFLNAISDYYTPSKNERFDIAQITENLQEKQIIGAWDVVRIKTGMPYTTFSTPESIEHILTYLEDNTPSELETCLFNTGGRQIPDYTFTKYFQRINERCGFGNRGRQIFFRSHALRKFFASTLYSKDLQQLTIDWMLGHKIPNKTTEAYFKSNPNSLKNQYMKLVEDLSIEKVKVRRVESEEVKKIVQELSDKDKKLEEFKEKLDEKDKEMESMNERVKLVESLLSDKDFANKLAHKLEKK